MNITAEGFPAEIFMTVLNMSVTGSLIICAVLLIRLCLKKLPRRFSYALWIIPAVRLLCPVAAASALSVFNLLGFTSEGSRMEYIAETPAVTQQSAEEPAETAEMVTTVYVPYESVQPAASVQEVSEAEPFVSEDALIPEETGLDRAERVFSAFAWIWLSVAAGVVVYSIATYVRVHLIVRNAAEAEGYYIAKNIESPFVFGLFKPGIYIPDGVSEEDLQCILAHENAHIRRFDHLTKFLCVPVLALHWFNPLAWLGCKLMTADMELSCDELALKNSDGAYRKIYANALLNMSMRQNRLTIGGVLSFGESNIKSRIKGVLSMKKPKLAAVIAAVTAIAVSAVCMLTNAEQSEEPDMSDYRSFRLLSDTEARECYPEDISEFIEFMDGLEYRDAGKNISGEEMAFRIEMFEEDNFDGRFSMMEFSRTGDEYYIEFYGMDNKDFKTYYLTEEEYMLGYSLFDLAAYHAFIGTVTKVVSDGIYLVTADEGGFPEGDVFVTSDEPLSYGDRVEVRFQGDVMMSAPLQINQVGIWKIEDSGSEFTGREYVTINGHNIPDLQLAKDMEPAEFRKQSLPEYDLVVKEAADCRFSLVGRYVFADASKDADKLYAYHFYIRLENGGSSLVLSRPALTDPENAEKVFEFDADKIDDYLRVFDMNGRPVAAFVYGGEITFFTVTDDAGEPSGKRLYLFRRSLSDAEYGSAASIPCSGGKLTLNEEQNMLIDGDGHTAYIFDFDNFEVSVIKAFLDPTSALENYFEEMRRNDVVSLENVNIRIPQFTDLDSRYLNDEYGFDNPSDFVIVYASYDIEYADYSSRASGHKNEAFALTAAKPAPREDYFGFWVFDSFLYDFENAEENQTAGYTAYKMAVPVEHMDEKGGVDYSGEVSEYVNVSFELPAEWDFSYTTADFDGRKMFEMGAAWYASDSYDFTYAGETTFTNEMGREVTVYETKFGTDGTYEYMAHSSVPDYYSENYTYETYEYIVRRGDYRILFSFVVNGYYDEAHCERFLKSLEIVPLSEDESDRAAADSMYYQPYSIVTQYGHANNDGGTSYGGSDAANEHVRLSFSLPSGWTADKDHADYRGGRMFDIGAIWPSGESKDLELMKTDQAYGREVTVIEESYNGGELYEYMLHSSRPPHSNTESGVDEDYKYVIERGGFMITVIFPANEYFSKAVCEKILESFTAEKFDVNSVDYSGIGLSAKYSGGKLNIDFQNDSEEEFTLRTNENIYKLENGEYKPLDMSVQIEIPMFETSVPAGEGLAWVYDLEEYYGKLESGSYRLKVCGRYSWFTGGYNHDFYADFEVS